MKTYRATGNDGPSVYGATPRDAAARFFATNPTKRTINELPDHIDGTEGGK